jgi:hypothetical protein
VQIGGHALHRLEAPFSQQIRAYTHTQWAHKERARLPLHSKHSAAAENKAAPEFIMNALPVHPDRRVQMGRL